MKVLVSAYFCEPEKVSEPGGGVEPGYPTCKVS